MKKRLFVAVDLPEEVITRVKMLCCGLPGAKWVNPWQLHLTLNFIGEADGALFLDIREALGEISSPSFTLQLDGLGFFPPRGKPNIVWAGVAENAALMTLQRKIQTRLHQQKIALEKRKFTPHITLARLKNTPASKVGRYLEEHGLFCSDFFPVKRFCLYSSVLGRNGAIHTVEEEYPLQEE